MRIVFTAPIRLFGVMRRYVLVKIEKKIEQNRNQFMDERINDVCMLID